MSAPTASELRRDPSILLARKRHDGLPVPQSFEGVVGAVIFGGSYFVTSPNMDHIWALPNNPVMTFKTDMRLGDDDPLLVWPQPCLEQFCYYAAIWRCPKNLKPTDIWNIVFHKLQAADCEYLQNGALSGLCNLGHRAISKIKSFISIEIDTKLAQQSGSYYDKVRPILETIHAIILRTLSHLRDLPMSSRQVNFLFAELQRYLLEFTAAYDYFTTYLPLMTGNQPPATKVVPVIGAFVQSAAQADAFFRAGLPVWLVRPARLAGSVRVDSLFEPLEAKDFLCLEDAYHMFPVSYRGSPTNPLKYFTFGRYCRNYISYGDAFQLEIGTGPVALPSRSSSRMLHNDKRPYPKPGKTSHRLHEPDSDCLPPSTRSWTLALASLETDPGRTRLCGQSDSKTASGYILPNPMLFVGTSAEKQNVFFQNWLKYRSALLFRATDWKNRPLSGQMWRDFLHLPINETFQPPSIPSSKTTKTSLCKDIVREILKGCTENSTDLRLSQASVHQLYWNGHQIPPETTFSGRLSQEILWELSELNFRAELTSLDLLLHRDNGAAAPLTPHYSREDEILFCFAGSHRTGIFVADIQMAGSGIAAEDWMIRRSYILSLRNVMSTWHGYQQAADGAKADVTVKMSTVLEYQEHKYMDFETAVIRLYLQFFFDCFGRPPTLPRRLDLTHLSSSS